MHGPKYVNTDGNGIGLYDHVYDLNDEEDIESDDDLDDTSDDEDFFE